ncbi:CAP domain-containing protein [Oscillatoria sp. CS-180]|uniref:CAP domain-containing protein n=1 Tax=Oscillatoria sp. CS-180 TaxID=3021720 RepID=UPI00232D19CB|nr:CAP domain-containing protein [Oscillatoria sp. CS-180]MDB9526102.1 CAP domain-containing protein [Oscillatoria sp. CS-180]
MVDIYSNLPGDGFSSEEIELYDLINEYRNQNGLPSIPASKALSIVANRHVWDLAENIGTLTHGWSDAPYNSGDPSTYSSMWNAPQRFNTGYPGIGFENAFFSSAGATAEGAFNGWRNSAPHNAVILNLNNWNDNDWNALGVGIYDDYAVIWFGEEADPTGTPAGFGTPSNFDPLQYGASYSDLIVGLGDNVAALTDHYNNHGSQEGREVDRFDEWAYLASNPDLIQAFGSNIEAATRHYILHGYAEGRSLNAFSASQYLASHRDLLTAFGNNPDAARKHYVESGYWENRAIDTFAEDIYIASHGDLINAFKYDLEGATQHYLNHGIGENRDVNLFDPAAYLNSHSDVRAAFGNDFIAATRHYINDGYSEGRTWS